MSLDSLGYLVGIYWPYLVGASAIGILAGWYAAGPDRRRDAI
jgi:hypothetical protein